MLRAGCTPMLKSSLCRDQLESGKFGRDKLGIEISCDREKSSQRSAIGTS